MRVCAVAVSPSKMALWSRTVACAVWTGVSSPEAESRDVVTVMAASTTTTMHIWHRDGVGLIMIHRGRHGSECISHGPNQIQTAATVWDGARTPVHPKDRYQLRLLGQWSVNWNFW
eukprot:m.228588 g.228588  ORF g.228588 m.228588 type:complete len:116 (-) comp25978_c0_seq1:997-1344(-)